jgi:hypothetical protein
MNAPQYKNGYLTEVLITFVNYYSYSNHFTFLLGKKVRLKSPAIGTHVGIFKGTYLFKTSSNLPLSKELNFSSIDILDYNYPIKYTNMIFNIQDMSSGKTIEHSIHIDGLAAISLLEDNPNDFGRKLI